MSIQHSDSWPADGTQIMLCNGHPWQGYTGVVTRDGATKGSVTVSLHDLPGIRAGVWKRAQIRVLTKGEER